MSDSDSTKRDQGLSSLSLDPDLLAEELAAEQDIDPLDAIEPEESQIDSQGVARAAIKGWFGFSRGMTSVSRG